MSCGEGDQVLVHLKPNLPCLILKKATERYTPAALLLLRMIESLVRLDSQITIPIVLPGPSVPSGQSKKTGFPVSAEI